MVHHLFEISIVIGDRITELVENVTDIEQHVMPYNELALNKHISISFSCVIFNFTMLVGINCFCYSIACADIGILWFIAPKIARSHSLSVTNQKIVVEVLLKNSYK